MPSSPAAARHVACDTRLLTDSGGAQHLLGLLESVPDPRKARGIRHRLPVAVALGVAAMPRSVDRRGG